MNRRSPGPLGTKDWENQIPRKDPDAMVVPDTRPMPRLEL